jgi:pilus assembly protein Flp/PilA
MFSYVTTWLQLKTDCRGVTAIEYGMIAALVALVVVVGATALGTSLSSEFTAIGTKV